MIYAILFFAAFLYFVADRKVRLSILPGIIVTLMTCYAAIWGSITMYYVRRGVTAFPEDIYRLASGNSQIAISLIAIPIFVVIAPICILAFLFLGKAIGKALFNPAKDGNGYNVFSKILYITASVLTAIAGLYFIFITCLVRRPDPNIINLYKTITKTFGSIGFRAEGAIAFGVILMLIGILCTVLICTKIPFFRTLKAEDPKKIERLKKSGKNPFAIVGFVLSGLGNLGVLITALVGLIIWQRVFFFDGYGYTQVLCAVFLLLMILGEIFLGIGLGRIKYQKKAGTRIAFLIVSLILIILSMADIIWLISNAITSYLLK